MMTENQKKISDLANCLFSFKLDDNQILNLIPSPNELLESCISALTLLGKEPDEFFLIDNEFDAETIRMIRKFANDTLEITDEISNFVSRAAQSGFLPPSNPILVISSFNESRNIRNGTISPDRFRQILSDDLLFNINVFIELLKKEKDGSLDLTGKSQKTTNGTAQLSSFTLSIDGFELAQAGGITDILNFLPDANTIKNKRIRNALGSLDFNKRELNVLFTANYDPADISLGCIVGWRKLHDASGYIIRRRDLFSGEEKEWTISNKSITEKHRSIKSYVDEWILSFYEFDNDDVFAYLDETIEKDNIYVYDIKGYQTIKTSTRSSFIVTPSLIVLSSLQINDMKSEMTAHVNETLSGSYTNVSFDDVSPYPFLSKKIYGHDKFDWILAATNVKAATDRGESKTYIRSLSYIGANFTNIDNVHSQLKLFKPLNPNDIITNITDSIAIYGLSQTLLDIIELTGLNMFFSEQETTDDGFKRASPNVDSSEFNEISTILSVINTNTATVDVSVLAYELSNIIKNKSNGVESTSSTVEINVQNDTSEEFSDNPLQFVSKFDINNDILDLTTFDGISDFIRIIRLFFDLLPNRSSFEPTEIEDNRTDQPVGRTAVSATQVNSTLIGGNNS